ncbi:MAG: OsmC family protein [Firmicutes bacterium]|jgi:osmotically inducible protein OsmC|nr:OsmC family protein [Bacillota bacterium]
MNLDFQVNARWSGVGKNGEGRMQLGDQSIPYSAPANMGGKGIGASPEDLLLSAVTACYSGTLRGVLAHAKLPCDTVAIRTDGVVEGFPEEARFARITVNPTIQGGDSNRQAEYIEAAQAARDRCFIGRTVRDSLDYAVGEVTVE